MQPVFIIFLVIPGLIICVSLVLFGLPGNFIIVLFSIGIKLISGYGNWWSTVLLLFMALLCELIEFFAGVKAASNEKTAKFTWFAVIIGSLAGGILGTPIFPVLGTLIGCIGGAFLLVFINEWLNSKNLKHSLDISVKVSKGVIYGKFSKLFISVLMAVILVVTL